MGGQFERAEKLFAEAAEALQPYAVDLFAFGLVHRAEAALAGRPKADAAGTVVRESVEQLKAVLEADGDGAIHRTLSFAPDYLLARKALAEGDAAKSKAHFANAYDRINRSFASRSLLVEDSFAMRCLALEIQNVNLKAEDLKARQGLLADLEKAFAWSLTPADKQLVAAAKAR